MMESLNKVTLIGRLIKPPITTFDEVTMTQFLVETTEKRKDGTTDFDYHNVVVFGRKGPNFWGIAKDCAEIKEVGRLIYVEGKLWIEETYVNDFNNGKMKVSESKIIAHKIRYCDIKY